MPCPALLCPARAQSDQAWLTSSLGTPAAPPSKPACQSLLSPTPTQKRSQSPEWSWRPCRTRPNPSSMASAPPHLALQL